MYYTSHNRAKILFLLLALLLILLFTLDLFLGSVTIPIKDIFRILLHQNVSTENWALIIWDFRLTKALTAIIAGIALSISGMQMQAVFRNPLAGPDVLGINAGAGFGVALVVLSLSFFSTIITPGNWTIAIAACIGAASVLFLIMAISMRVKDIMAILIIGIMLSAGISSMVSILQFFGNEIMLKTFVVWTLGSLSQIGWPQLQVLTIAVLIGSLLSFYSIKNLNALLIGEKYAKSMGMNIRLTRIIIFVSTSLLAGSVTAFCGPIAFVAIAVPHLCRMLFKTGDHRILWWASALLGASVMLFSDIIAQLPGSKFTLPINSITSLIGIPIVIWIVVSNNRSNIFSNKA